jgi:hypothetical protein
MQQGLYKAVGYDSFEEWLADPEVDIERRWAYQLSATWRELVVKLGTPVDKIRQLEPAKIQEVLPAVRRGAAEIGEALADVESLSRSDLREKYAGVHLDGAQVRDQTLESTQLAEWAVCPACGGRYRVSESGDA